MSACTAQSFQHVSKAPSKFHPASLVYLWRPTTQFHRLRLSSPTSSVGTSDLGSLPDIGSPQNQNHLCHRSCLTTRNYWTSLYLVKVEHRILSCLNRSTSARSNNDSLLIFSTLKYFHKALFSRFHNDAQFSLDLRAHLVQVPTCSHQSYFFASRLKRCLCLDLWPFLRTKLRSQLRITSAKLIRFLSREIFWQGAPFW